MKKAAVAHGTAAGEKMVMASQDSGNSFAGLVMTVSIITGYVALLAAYAYMFHYWGGPNMTGG